MRILDLGTDQIPVGESISWGDLLMAFESPGGYKTAPGPNPADAERATPTRNAKRIDELEEMVDALFQMVEGLTRQVKVLWSARQKSN
nr:hypothetical protein [bacterium]